MITTFIAWLTGAALGGGIGLLIKPPTENPVLGHYVGVLLLSLAGCGFGVLGILLDVREVSAMGAAAIWLTQWYGSTVRVKLPR